MTDRPWIHYTFAGGRLENPDGTRTGRIDGPVAFADVNDDSAAPRHALVLSHNSGTVETPALPGLELAESVRVGIDIRPMGDASRMYIVVGSAAPYRLFLDNAGDAYRVGAAVHTQRGWIEIVAESTIPRGKWSSVSLVGTDSDFVLFAGTKLVARRVLDPMDVRVPTGDGGFVVNDVAPKFVGELGSLIVDVWVEEPMQATIDAARTDGVGEITSKHLDLGGLKGLLKQPTGPEVKVAGGRSRPFAGGAIYWHKSTGAHEVHGKILAEYIDLDGPTGPLGFPTGDEGNAATKGARRGRFQHGAIYWSAGTGAHAVLGEIFLRYLGLGEDESSLGLPVAGEQKIADGRVSSFKGGRLYWSSATGAFLVRGAILEHYLALGGPAELGFPMMDEGDILDKKGKPTGARLSRFQGPTIYWSKQTGARSIYGALRARYEALGGPRGPLGLPRSDETALKGTDIRYNDFERGVIAWKPSVGAREFTAFTLHLGRVTTGKIKDAANTNNKAELVTYHWVKVDGQALADGIRRPSGHAGTSYDIQKSYEIPHVRASTEISLKINAVDYDPTSENDFLASREVTFSLENFFGQLAGSPPGHYVDVPATAKGGDAYNLDTVKFTYSLAPVVAIDPKKPFRQQYWWACNNPSTPVLSLEQYAATFRDISHLGSNFDKALHLLEYLFYESAYKKLAASGNCFGMCLEAIYARKNRSIFAEPIHAIHVTKNGSIYATPDNVEPGFVKVINLKHGYQLGASVIRWLVRRFFEWDLFQPLEVYNKVKLQIIRGDLPVVCMARIGSGHAVLPYDYKDGAGTKQDPHRLYVADPNVPYTSKQAGKDASYIAIYGDNTFKFFGSGNFASDKPAKGLLPRTVLIDIPFDRLSDIPRTPIWEILAAVTFIGFMILVGDAGDAQISTGGKNLYDGKGSQRRIVKGAVPGLMPVPAVDAAGLGGEMVLCDEKLPNALTMAVRGTKKGNYQRLLATPNRVLQLTAPTQKDEVDELHADGLRARGIALRLGTAASKKRFEVAYGAALVNHGPPTRRFVVNMQVAKGTPAHFRMETDERALLVCPSGPASTVWVTLESYVKGKWVRSRISCSVAVGDCIRVSPQSWTEPGCKFVVEHMKGDDSRMVTREVVQGEAIDLP